jgi:hypothetical protein
MPIKKRNKGTGYEQRFPLTKTQFFILIIALVVMFFLLAGRYMFVGNSLLSEFFHNDTYVSLGIMIVFFIGWILDKKMPRS